jgi:hypothetical protein
VAATAELTSIADVARMKQTVDPIVPMTLGNMRQNGL